MISGLGSSIVLGGFMARGGTGDSAATNGTIIANADNEMVAIKFCPETNQHVTHVDMCLGYAGDCTGSNFKLGIYADSADTPDTGTLLGGLTAEFAGLNAGTGWAGGGTDPIELSAHADLTANTPYWLVLARTSGATSLDGTHTVAPRGMGGAIFPMRVRLFNGTDWTTTAASVLRASFIIKVGSYCYGLPFITSVGSSAQTHIFSTNKQGISFKTGNKVYLRGVLFAVTIDPTPSELIVTVYSNTTELTHVHVPTANIVSTVPMIVYFPTPVELVPDVISYIILSSPDSADTNNDYTLRTNAINANYITACSDDNFRMVVGTDSPPTTAVTTEYPNMWPVVTDMLVDLDQAAADFPDVGNVTEDDTVNGSQGTYHEPTTAEVQDGVMFGASSALEGTYVGGGGGAINLDKMGAL